jgi:hypothetical protein
MTITTKIVDLKDTDCRSAQQYAESQNGVYMNMLGGVRYDEVSGKYILAPIKYSDANLEGEKIRFANGMELQVIFSCLAKEYKNKKEVYNKWWSKAENLVKMYKEQKQIENYVKAENLDLKKLRDEGSLDDGE